MNKTHCLLALATTFAMPLQAGPVLIHAGQPATVIVRQIGLSAPEESALQELAATLGEIAGQPIPVVDVGVQTPPNAIIVGNGPAARAAFPDVPYDDLGLEEIVVCSRDGRLLLAGGRPRGTVYAVSHFLQRYCGVRWWTSWASEVPRRQELVLPDLEVRYAPPFESRDPFWYPAYDTRWAVRNFSNSQSAHIPAEWGGCIRYKGFVHTFYPLVPPQEHFADHPEWYSLINGERTVDRAQLCLTNPGLRAFVVERVKQWLRESPEARIVSVSQNDWYRPCECDACKALDDREGSHAGSMLDFVNFVAEQIESEFPLVAVDTLAYQYTRKPPRTIRPRPNVIIRLCSIECNFREPLEAPVNAAFADDIRGWAEICDRLYIWDYTTDFAHYLQPHPNWFVLGPNVRFFAANHVRGLFEQGAYQSYGSEFTELRAWVLAQLLWDPTQDDRALIDEFLTGYYGKAAPFIREYMAVMHEASAGWKLSCFSKTDTPFFNFGVLAQSEALWRKAEAAVADQPEVAERVHSGRIWLGYVWLSLWDKLRDQCHEANGSWPLPESKAEFGAQWLRWTEGDPAKPWTRITLVRESGVTNPAKWLETVLPKTE
ncbi:MAG: DUF4838 domain-containing protein [Verrucomicrobiales bacterium]|nr:DUF4838 domain-containing protein [Verrucomicrobiales bacterium]